MATAAKSPESERRKLLLLSLGALGVVYGDIGTSPLYAFRVCFVGPHAIAPTADGVLGVLSLVFWALALTISIKYLLLVLRADNQGEGGILALMQLVLPERGARRAAVIAVGLFGAALLYGDGTITPAISVLSAVEGVNEAEPVLSPFILPITIAVLFLLFLFQRRGTGRVGFAFGPIMLAWFPVIAALGLVQIVHAPQVLLAVNPVYGARFLAEHGAEGLFVLGAVFLTVTGGEALYADIGHFGRTPIRMAWFAVVLPSLLLNYFGQGALVLRNPAAVSNPFYQLAPHWALFPMVLLAMAATIIASQAIISGVYSLTFQAQQLGYLPRLRVRHTSEEERGQIYMPQVNWILFIFTVIVVFGFRSSENLSGAYGVAVSMTMVITTLLAFSVFRKLWGWPVWITSGVVGLFLVIDVSFLGSNLLKILDGGWYPIFVGIALYLAMSTWSKGQELVGRQIEARVHPIDEYLAKLDAGSVQRVEGTAVFFSRSLATMPLTFIHNFVHNRVIHERVILVSVQFERVPHVRAEHRIELQRLEHGFFRVTVRYGFMDRPNIRAAFRILQGRDFEVDFDEATFFVGRESFVPTRTFGLAIWRDWIYVALARNAERVVDYFGLPPDRVFEIGAQIRI